MDEGQIEQEVDVLRTKLLANLSAMGPPVKKLKASDTHGLALAKKTELSKMAMALGTRADYTEGEAFDREKQEEKKMKRMVEREEREEKKAQEMARMEAQKKKWEEERRERDRLRRREEDRARRERDGGELRRKEAMTPPPLPNRERGSTRDYREPPRGGAGRRSRSPRRRSPPPRD